MYQYELEAAYFPNQAAEVQEREYAILKGFQAFPEAPGDVFKSLDYPDILS